MKKKNVLVLFMIFITISFSVFSKNDKVAKGENVEFRNGYYYLIGDKEPFTGTIEFLNDNGIQKIIHRIALNSAIIPHGKREELLKEEKLKGESLIERIEELIYGRKK